MKKQFSILVVGAGNRGQIYSNSMKQRYPDTFRISAVCEPDPEKRAAFAAQHGISAAHCYADLKDVARGHRVADAAIISTPDRAHFAAAKLLLEKGMALLLEKPVGVTKAECRALSKLAEQKGLPVVVCHVLRYTAFFREIHTIIQSGGIGDVQTIVHTEEIAPFHMTHSYVRGRWARAADSSPVVLAKCSHDLDLIQWYAGAKPVKVFSKGALRHYQKLNAPPGAPQRCTDGCPHATTCSHEAVGLYLHTAPIKQMLADSDSAVVRGLARIVLAAPSLLRVAGLGRFVDHRGWPVNTITHDLTDEGIMRALREGPFGRCVYRCDNDQVDHQVTMLEFSNGVTGSLVFHGFSTKEGRRIRIVGDRGSIRGTYGVGARLEITRNGKTLPVRVRSDLFGHSEGDHGVVRHFADVLEGRAKPETSISESLASHETAFAAYESMRTGRVIRI